MLICRFFAYLCQLNQCVAYRFMKLSIIVPVYNVELYLERCVQSIIAQDVDDCEVLLIDDGSTDRSGELCDELQRRYGCVKVIHQQNGGLSAARNSGINIACGEYITFVDSDDELCRNTLKGNLDFLFTHPEVDMLEYPVEVHAESPKAYMLNFHDEMQDGDVFVDWIRREGYKHCYAYNKIYAARVWKEVRFPVGVCFEDAAIMPDIIRRCQCIYYSSLGCYRYVMHVGSITTSYSYVKIRQLFSANYGIYLRTMDNPLLRMEALKIWVVCLNQLTDMGRCKDVVMDDYISLIKYVDNNRPTLVSLLKTRTNLKSRLKLLVLSVVGLRLYCFGYRGVTSTL